MNTRRFYTVSESINAFTFRPEGIIREASFPFCL